MKLKTAKYFVRSGEQMMMFEGTGFLVQDGILYIHRGLGTVACFLRWDYIGIEE